MQSASGSRYEQRPKKNVAAARRAKTSMRARRILCAMEAGFEQRQGSRKSHAQGSMSSSASDSQRSGRSREGANQHSVTHSKDLESLSYIHPPTQLKLKDRCSTEGAECERQNSSERSMEGATNIVRGSEADCREAPKASSVATHARNELSYVNGREPRPSVPLFSAASKKQIVDLTSRDALRDGKNPITHSAVGRGTMHYVSSSTGHQVANRVSAAGPAPEGWWSTRMRKLKHQAEVEIATAKAHGANVSADCGSASRQAYHTSTIFTGCMAYFNGYTGAGIGNKELQRLFALHGGTVHYLPNGSTTHIVSAMQLSAKKRQDMLHLQTRRVKKFVKVEW